ncbi:hypothetical protein Achl_4007 (plasmid) [Pseudarthrobacter chlorophenolicus A6]|uniref:Uncharacterized protein n=1 Tax=Pseudarthrobacter chlorophenolicus (strain ATCC 700700 / DSM 12829 / CIP 107037 / JCM 12360 / KCTC 9906 / NCIMB 13794 / A6) TaxID=452863 RepID=B8HHR1_PSECP|nr:hypothetical protein [Pseudarthrobacter chlorophenolicus]ACL41958.1 hypothetical protein Achl_4007 [Pseudarthrobacter chlorophenolicus A6]SDQ19457.1 hypothetical protein SAMN04489738_0658 [Pseudarthrobacter chlorophenolicus]
MTTPTARQPRGIPAGGQFAATTRTEPSLILSAPVVAPEYVEHRLAELGLGAHLSVDQINEVSTLLNDSKDFTDRNIQIVADDLHLRAHGYSASQARDAQEGLSMLRAAGLNEQADALEAVTDARLANARGAAAHEYSGHARHASDPVLADGKTVPVPADDPRVQAGEVFDRVAAEGNVFARASTVDSPHDTQAIRFQANRPLSDEEAYALSGVVGYANRAAIGGEPLDDPQRGPARDTPYSFIARIDTNKGRQGDFEKFESMIPDIISNGSAPRSTKGGTRAIEPFADQDLKLEIYYAE